MTFFSTID